jgi:GAF domain-containing protein
VVVELLITVVVSAGALVAARVIRLLGRPGLGPSAEVPAATAWPAAPARPGLAGLDLEGDAGRGILGAVAAAGRLPGVDQARLLLAGADGPLRWATAVDRRGGVVADRHRRLAAGPCLAAFADVRTVAIDDVDADPRRVGRDRRLPWATMSASLNVPIEGPAGPLGVLELSRARPGSWDDAAVAAARAVAAVVGLLLAEAAAAHAARTLAGQLQHALSARIRVEQAKGVLMAREGLGEPAAWERLRRAARAARRPVDAVARDLLAELPGEAGRGGGGR